MFDSLLHRSIPKKVRFWSTTWYASFILASIGILLWSTLAYAHGDDDVTAATFIGPMVAFIIFVVVVGLGKAFLRMIIRRV